MKHRYLLVLVGCAAFASPACAQSSGRDPEIAVALAIRSSLPSGPIAFESRELSEGTGAAGEERGSAKVAELASVLRAKPAHEEDVRKCSAPALRICTLGGYNALISMYRPTVAPDGKSATVVISKHFLSGSARHPAVAVIDMQYTVTLVGGRWVVTHSRVVRES